jgi:hypothetical protein
LCLDFTKNLGESFTFCFTNLTLNCAGLGPKFQVNFLLAQLEFEWRNCGWLAVCVRFSPDFSSIFYLRVKTSKSSKMERLVTTMKPTRRQENQRIMQNGRNEKAGTTHSSTNDEISDRMSYLLPLSLLLSLKVFFI